MARIVDFADGAQSETTPTIGNIIASGIITYPDDATYEATEQNAPQSGNIYFNTTTNFLRYYNGTLWIDIVDDESLQTLINKTIDADLNTITNIDNDEIKANAGIDVTKLHDGSVDNTEFGHLDGVTSPIQTQLDAKQNLSEKGQPNGYAELDGSGQVPASQLPSYVDDVLEFADLPSFPATGETGKIYIALDTDVHYRWTGSMYIVTGNGVVELSDLTDVDTTGVTDGQVLFYNSTNTQFEPGNIVVNPVIQENIALVGKGTATWTVASGTSNVSVAQSLTNTNDFAITSTTESGYTFTPSQSGPLQFVVGKFIDNGLAGKDGIVQAKLYATSGGLPTGAAIATSNSFGTVSTPVSTEFDNNFLFSSNPLLTAGTEYAIVYDSTDTGTLFARRGNIDEPTSSNVSENGAPPPDWELNPVQETIYHEVFVEVTAGNTLVLDENSFISVPPLEDDRHRILAQTISMTNGECAYINLDRAASGATDLTVFVDDITNVTPDNTKLIIARSVNDECYFGIHDPQRLQDGDSVDVQKGGTKEFINFPLQNQISDEFPVSTMSASGNYADMSNNSVVLEPGKHLIDAQFRVLFQGGSNAVTLQQESGFYETNGNDTSSPPAPLTGTVYGISNLQKSFGSINKAGQNEYYYSGNIHFEYHVESTTTIYLVPRVTWISQGTPTITGIIKHKKISEELQLYNLQPSINGFNNTATFPGTIFNSVNPGAPDDSYFEWKQVGKLVTIKAGAHWPGFASNNFMYIEMSSVAGLPAAKTRGAAWQNSWVGSAGVGNGSSILQPANCMIFTSGGNSRIYVNTGGAQNWGEVHFEITYEVV